MSKTYVLTRLHAHIQVEVFDHGATYNKGQITRKKSDKDLNLVRFFWRFLGFLRFFFKIFGICGAFFESSRFFLFLYSKNVEMLLHVSIKIAGQRCKHHDCITKTASSQTPEQRKISAPGSRTVNQKTFASLKYTKKKFFILELKDQKNFFVNFWIVREIVLLRLLEKYCLK